MGVEGNGLDRIRQELADDRLWKARDRVTGLFAARPSDPEVLKLAGEVYFRMGDLPRAAAFWFLTDHSGPDVDAARAAMDERYPRPTDLATALPIRDRIEVFPPPVQDRLRVIQRAVKERHGYDWEPAPRRQRSQNNDVDDSGIAIFLIGSCFFLGIVGVWLVGVFTLVRSLLGLG